MNRESSRAPRNARTRTNNNSDDQDERVPVSRRRSAPTHSPRLLSLALAALATAAASAATPRSEVSRPRVAEFSDVVLTNAVRGPGGFAKALARGTIGRGLALDETVPIEWPELRREGGYLSFWLRPRWGGADGRAHRLLRIGDPHRNGLSLEKSALGYLRFAMSSPGRTIVARADVRAWKAGEWHHVVLGWFSRQGQPVGLPLWLDRVAVDGPTANGCEFLDPSALKDTRLWLGDATAGADLDELILRDRIDAEGPHGMVAAVYRDYFRTAPYDRIAVDPEPARVPADRRVIAGGEKQFGLQARREGHWEPVTEHAVRYSQWTYFDAKPLIQWKSSDPSVATVDPQGRVHALRAGKCRIRAEFHGLTAEYPLEAISPLQADATLIGIELLPRYPVHAFKNRPAAGDRLTTRVRVGNFGAVPLPAGARVTLDLVPPSESDAYRFDERQRPTTSFTQGLDRPLARGEETAVEFAFPAPEKPLWMRARIVGPAGAGDLCRANDEVTERTDARPIQLGYRFTTLRQCLAERRVNHVGSFCYYDWLRAQKLRMDVLLREAVWPTTTPHGVPEAYRVDAFTPLTEVAWDDQEYRRREELFDGGFPVNEPVDLMAIDAAIIHEFGHTILSQPDLYGYGVRGQNVLLRDGQGRRYAGTPIMPVVQGDDGMPFSPSLYTPCGQGYASLMDGCQLWLPPAQAGHVRYYKGYRPDRFWGTQGRLMATRAHWLQIEDIEDRPLTNAAVYVYHVSQAPVQDSGAKYFADRPKFIGQTDAEGRFIFPDHTDEDWDDAATDEVDGAVQVWNPFGGAKTDTAFTPNVWTVEGLLLIKIVSGGETEFRWMDQLEFNDRFLRGNTVRGVYPVRTCLRSSSAPTPIERRPVPEAIRKTNRRPVAVAPARMTVKRGESFEIDGSASTDPEGQPLEYRWGEQGRWLAGDLHQGPVPRLQAPNEPGKRTYTFYVLDGLRCSDKAEIEVTFE